MPPSSPLRCLALLALTLAGALGPLALPVAALDFAALTQSVSPERAARYEVFRRFQIRGVCGTTQLELAAAHGANTLRTYTPPTRAQLDDYQSLGLRVVVGIWMPHPGENSGRNGKWTYDYATQGEKQLKDLADVIDRIGDHPAILLWCLGNEVPLERPYLETVERMSQLIHARYPRQLTSLTMVNAPKDKLALIRAVAPDLDLIGCNSYGQGAVSGSSRNLEEAWGRAYYVSEFGPPGPWGGRKTAWGVHYEPAYDAKIADLRQSLERIDAAPHCLGSTMFLWGAWQKGKEFPTYFSAFLPPQLDGKHGRDDPLYRTPIADEFLRYWSGRDPAERAPVLKTISLAGREGAGDAAVAAGQPLRATATASDPVATARPLRYRWWVLDPAGKVVRGPVDTPQPAVELPPFAAKGETYALLVYVIAEERFASGFSLPFRVE